MQLLLLHIEFKSATTKSSRSILYNIRTAEGNNKNDDNETSNIEYTMHTSLNTKCSYYRKFSARHQLNQIKPHFSRPSSALSKTISKQPLFFRVQRESEGKREWGKTNSYIFILKFDITNCVRLVQVSITNVTFYLVLDAVDGTTALAHIQFRSKAGATMKIEREREREDISIPTSNTL